MQTPRTPAGSAAELAARHGLVRTGSRPTFGSYLAAAWRRRHFATTLATSRAYARNQNNYLGQLWAVLTPCLWAAVYLFVFGFLLNTSRGVDNFIGFLVIGVFLFRFTSSAMSAGSGAVVRHQALITSLQFPRVLLPLAVVLAELFTLLPALVVLLIVVPLSGEPITVRWLLLPVAVLLLYLFVTGVAMVLARLVAQVRDVANLVPFLIRALMYVSGVFFSVEHYAGSGTLGNVLSYQPVAVYLQLARGCLLEDMTVPVTLWLWGLGWALLALAVGLVWFWQGEERYGRG
jgi:teichoic acid transport system permease protein